MKKIENRFKNLKYGTLIGLSMAATSCKSLCNIMPERDGDIISRDDKVLMVPSGTCDTMEIDNIPTRGKYLLTKYIDKNIYMEIPYVDGIRHGRGRTLYYGNVYINATYENGVIKKCKNKSENNTLLKFYFYDNVFTDQGIARVRTDKNFIWPSCFENDMHITQKLKHEKNIRDKNFRVVTKIDQYKIENFTPEIRPLVEKAKKLIDIFTKNICWYIPDCMEIYHDKDAKISHIRISGMSMDANFWYAVNVYADGRKNEIMFNEYCDIDEIVRYGKSYKVKSFETKLCIDDNFNILDENYKPFSGHVMIGNMITNIQNGKIIKSNVKKICGHRTEALYENGKLSETTEYNERDSIINIQKYLINNITQHHK